MTGTFKIHITHNQISPAALKIFSEKLPKSQLIISEPKGGSSYPVRETLLNDIKGADAVLWFGHVHVDKEMLDAAGKQLKVVGSIGAGYDHIDVNLLKERNIKVSNTPGILSSAVADMALALMLAVSRNLLPGYQAILEDKWVVNHPSWMCGPTLEEATVGIIGMGDIGCKIAKRVKSFDIGRLLYSNRTQRPEAVELGAKFVSLDQLLAESDFVFVAVPLTPETKHLLDLSKFKKMKPTSILINIARGDVINQDDLVTALQSKVIGGAALDVMTPEPLPYNHVLTTLPNVVLSPHLSSATFRTRSAMAKLAVENICNALTGQELITPIK